jgi:hypothetical protein
VILISHVLALLRVCYGLDGGDRAAFNRPSSILREVMKKYIREASINSREGCIIFLKLQ